MSQSSESRLVGFAHASALVLQCSIKMIHERPAEYRHGVTKDEVAQVFPRLMGFSLATYGNRLRDNFGKYKTMGRHDVHGRRHYFPVVLDEYGVIDHSVCCNCQKPKQKR